MMKSIYILLTKSDTWVSKVIKLTTDDKYTHASISFEESLQPMYSFSRKYVNLPLPAGLRTEPLTKGFFQKYRYIPCALYELKVEDTMTDIIVAAAGVLVFYVGLYIDKLNKYRISKKIYAQVTGK